MLNIFRKFDVVKWIAAFGSLVATSLLTVEIMRSPIFPPVALIESGDVRVLDNDPTNGRLNIVYRYKRNKMCATSQGRWLWRYGVRDGKPIPIVVPLDQSTVPFTEPTDREQEVIISYTVPPGLDPGEWFFVFKSMDWCSLTSFIIGPVIRETPSIPVTIGEKS